MVSPIYRYYGLFSSITVFQAVLRETLHIFQQHTGINGISLETLLAATKGVNKKNEKIICFEIFVTIKQQRGEDVQKYLTLQPTLFIAADMWIFYQKIVHDNVF